MAGSKKAAGVRNLFKPSVPDFPAAADPHKPLNLAALSSRRSSSLLLLFVLPPFGRLDVNMMVDVERAPYPGAASRLFAASSDTHVHRRPIRTLLSPTHL